MHTRISFAAHATEHRGCVKIKPQLFCEGGGGVGQEAELWWQVVRGQQYDRSGSAETRGIPWYCFRGRGHLPKLSSLFESVACKQADGTGSKTAEELTEGVVDCHNKDLSSLLDLRMLYIRRHVCR
jgi:hypothetical protein